MTHLTEGSVSPWAMSPEKRAVDLLMACTALILLSPLLVTVALAVRLILGTPILFRQQRPGFRGRPFNLLKFRTMSDARNADGQLLSDGERLGAFGKFLRASSMDELPELWNIVRGDMSLVGPRPLLIEYMDKYSPQQARRHLVRPGLTGWAQVNGRNLLAWSEKFRYDVWYVEHASPSIDLQIVYQTVKAVLMRRGVSAPSHATMPPFEGDRPS